MSNEHFIEKCKICKVVIAQCRCMAADKSERWSICSDCSDKYPTEKSVLVPTLVRNCARCGQTHEVFFKKFTIPPSKADYTHFAECPVTGEPILMRMVEVPEE